MRPKDTLPDGIYSVAKIIIVGGQAWKIVGFSAPKTNQWFVLRSISVFGWSQAGYDKLLPEYPIDRSMTLIAQSGGRAFPVIQQHRHIVKRISAHEQHIYRNYPRYILIEA